MANEWDFDFLHNLLEMKKSSVAAGARAGKTAREISAAIQLACDCLMSGATKPPTLPEPEAGMDISSADRNLNEAIADKALEILGKVKGAYDIIRPDEDVAQSLPAETHWTGAGRNTVISLLTQAVSRMTSLSTAVTLKAAEFSSIVRPGTISLMGLPYKEMTTATAQGHESSHLGHALHGCASMLRRDIGHLKLVQSEMRDAAETAWSQDTLAYAFGVMKAAALHALKIAQTLRSFAEIPWILVFGSAYPSQSEPAAPASESLVDEMCEQTEMLARVILHHDLAFSLTAGLDGNESESGDRLLFLNLFDAIRKLSDMADLILTAGVRGLAVNHRAYEQDLLERTGTLLHYHGRSMSANTAESNLPYKCVV